MTDDEPASPACLAHEADDMYMGFATTAQIGRFRTELAAASLAAKAGLLRKMLPKIRDDRIHAEFSALLNSINAMDSNT